MKIISWNLSYFHKTEPKIAYLSSLLSDDDFIVVLQEVTESAYEAIAAAFPSYPMEFSLQIRKPGKYDTKARKLGIVILCSKSISIEATQVLDRSPFPDRTLLAHCHYRDTCFSVMGLHSVTGCDYDKAKSVQFYSFAEAVDTYRPAVVCFDANEPERDHFHVHEMTFFDNKDKGDGARTFFIGMIEQGLSEAYSASPDADKEALPYSHCLRTIKKRYDFIFLNEALFQINNLTYDYDGAKRSGSDHAIVASDVSLRQ